MKDNKMSVLSILNKLESIEEELREVREEFERYAIPSISRDNAPTDLQLEYTLMDLYEAFGAKKHQYATRLCHSLEKKGIKTLAEFLALTPGQLLDLDAVGYETLQQTNKALKKLGIRW